MSNLQVALAYSFSENELPHRPIYPLHKEVDTESIVTPSYIAQTGFSPEDLSPITVGGHYDPKSILNEITPTPLNIYLYVRNNFNFEPYYGFLKGPSLTNLDKSGNDLDLAVLLVYLLRSASYPAKYVYGTITLPSDKVINWLGVNTTEAALSLLKAAGIPSRLTVTNEGIASIELEHFWVEVYYEGKWYALDPSFKEYVYYQPESIVEDWLNGSKIVKDLIDNTNFDGYYIKMAQPSIFTSPDLNSSNIISAVNGTTGFIISKGANEISLGDVETFNKVYSGIKLDALGGKEIVPEITDKLPASLPFTVVAHLKEYSEVPSEMVYNITIESGSLKYTRSISELGGRRVTLTFLPTTAADLALRNKTDLSVGPISNINVTPALLIDGELVANGSSMLLGTDTSLNVTIVGPTTSYSKSVTVVSGGIYVVVLDHNRIFESLLRLRQDRLSLTNKLMEYGIRELSLDEVTGESFYITGLSFWKQWMDYVDHLGSKIKVAYVRYPSVLLVGSGIEVVKSGDTPISLKTVGVYFNILFNLITPVSHTNDRNAELDFLARTAVRSSKLEASVIEEFLELPSFSTQTIFEHAAAEGIRIVMINSSNVEVLDSLAINASDKVFIREAVNSGLTVLVPERNILIGDWNGTGYYITNMTSGACSYMLTGGIQGGWGRGWSAWIQDALGTIVSGMLKTFDKASNWARVTPIVGRILSAADTIIGSTIDLYYSSPCDFWTKMTAALAKTATTIVTNGLLAYVEVQTGGTTTGIIQAAAAEGAVGFTVNEIVNAIQDYMISELGLDKPNTCADPELEVYPVYIDLGKVKYGDVVTGKLMVRNKNYRDMNYEVQNLIPLVFEIKTVDPALRFSPSRGSATSSQIIDITLDTRKIPLSEVPEKGEKTFFSEVEITSNSKYVKTWRAKITYKLTTEEGALVVVNPPSLTKTYIQGKVFFDTLKFRINSLGKATVYISPGKIPIGSGYLQVDLTKVTFDDKGSNDIEVLVSVPPGTGTYTGTFNILAEYTQGNEVKKTTIPLLITIVVEAQPKDKDPRPPNPPDQRNDKPQPPGGDHPDDTFDVSTSFLEQKTMGYSLIAMAVKKSMPYAESLQTISRTAKLLSTLAIEENMSLYVTSSREYATAYALASVNSNEVLKTLSDAPNVVIMDRGYSDGAKVLLSDLGIPFSVIPSAQVVVGSWVPEDLARIHPIMILPSGSLFGISSQIFKAKLEKYVEAGGTIIAFSQQYGADFNVLPGSPNGFGWSEDQMCYGDAAYIDTLMPIVSSQSYVTISEPIDGYFTSYPSETTVILRRTKNDFPAMILYPFGKGYVIATTMYTDWSHTKGGAMTSGMHLVRDAIAWALSDKQKLQELPIYRSSSVEVTVKNTSPEISSSVALSLISPSGDIVKRQVYDESIPPGGSKNLTLEFYADRAGIWKVDAILVHENGTILSTMYSVLEVAVSYYKQYPDSFNYRGGAEYQMWVTADEKAKFGSQVTFTINVRNRANAPLSNHVIVVGVHEEGDEGGVWWKEYGPQINITVPNDGEVHSFSWTCSINVSGSFYFGIYDSSTISYSQFLTNAIIRAEKGVWVSYPYLSLSTSLDKQSYNSNDVAKLQVNITDLSKNPATWNLNLEISLRNSTSREPMRKWSVPVLLDRFNSTLVDIELPNLIPITYFVTVNVKLGDLFVPRIYRYDPSADRYYTWGDPLKDEKTFTRIRPEALMDISISEVSNQNIKFNITSSVKNNVKLNEPFMEVIFYYPDNSYDRQILQLSFVGNSNSTLVSFPLNDLIGNYRVVYVLYEKSYSYNTPFNLSIKFDSVSFNRMYNLVKVSKPPSVKEGEMIYLNLTLRNIAPFDDTLNVNLSIPSMNTYKSQKVSISANSTSEVSFDITVPNGISVGSHTVYVYLETDQSKNYIGGDYLYVPTPYVTTVSDCKNTLNAGESFNFSFINQGGVKTSIDYTVSLYLTFDTPFGAKADGTAEISAGGSMPISFQLPSDIPGGWYYLIINYTDKVANREYRTYYLLNVPVPSPKISLIEERVDAGTELRFNLENVGGSDTFGNITAYLRRTWDWTNYASSKLENVSFNRSQPVQLSIYIPSDLSTGEYQLVVVVEDQRQSISAYCPINVKGLEYETEITSTSVNAGEKIELLIKNKGGVNAKFTIDANIGGTQWSGSIELTKGASGTLYIPVPISLETGVHYLNLKFSNNITSEVRSLRYSINVVGMKLEASLVEKNINAGQYLEISIKNVGGTDLNMDVTGYLISSDGRKFDLPATNFALEKGKTGTLKMKVPESVPTGTYRFYINFADKNTGKTTTFQDEVQIAGFSIAVQLEQYTLKAGDIVNFTIINTGGTKVVADITVSIDGTSSSQQGTIDVGSSKEFGFKLPDTMETRGYTLTIRVKDSISGNTEDFSFEVTISGLAFELELAKTSYDTGETVDLVLENSGASPANCSYQAKLTDSKIIFAENSGSANLSPGEKLTIPIQIPNYLKSGNYRIKLVINETTVNQIYILERSLSIKGTDAKITLEPNKSAYFNDESIIITVPLSEQLKGELILRVLGHGKGGVEKYYSLVDIQSIGIEDGYVWISAPGVIARYSEITGEVEFFPMPPSEQHEHFGKSLISVGSDYVWVNRGAELLRFDKSAKSWLVYNSENTNGTLPQQFGEIRSLISDQNAVYLLITDFMEYKIAIYDISSNKWTTYNARQISQDLSEIKDIAINGSDLWAVVDIGLAKFDGTSWEILNAPLNNVNKLAISGGVMWISSSNKLARLDGGTWESIDPPPNVNIISIFIDGSSLWAIFDNNAVGKYDNGWSIYTQSSAYPYNIISKAFQVCPSQNKIWFALRGTGFASLDRTSSSLEQHSYGPSGSAIEHVVSDGQSIFVVSRNSSWGYCLDRFEISSQTWERISEIDFANSMVLFDDKVLLGNPERIVSYDTSTGKITSYQTGSGTIILIAKDGYVWISNSSGTYRSQSLESWEKMFDDVFKAIVQSDEGIWAMKSFDDKLYFYNASTGQWRTLTTDDGLLPGTISSIALFEDALWISYGSNKTTRLETSTGVVTHFDPSNSSISNEVYRLVSAGENLWFIHSMGGGIAYYNSTGWGSYSESVISNAVNDIYYKNGVYWFGTENGLIEIGEGIKTLQTLKKTFNTSPTPFQLDPIRDKGTYYLMAVLKNNFDQVLEEKSTTLQVYERATKLSIQTERDYYKENENFIVKIIVENNAPIKLEDNLKVAIGSVELPKVPISISPGESYVQTLPLALNSTTEISAEVTGSSATKTVNIVKPTADVSIDAPTSVGRDPFNVSVFINNTSPIPISIELRLNETRKQMLLQIGESVTVSEQFQIAENSTIDVEISGDVSYKKSVLVEYVERCKVSFNTNEPYREGSVMFNYTAENIGKIDTQFEVTTRIGDQVKNISISLSPGGSKEGYVIFDLPPGKYKFEYSYYMGNGSIDFMVYKAVNLNLTSSVEAKYGKLELDISLENLVPFTFTGNLTWDVGFLKKNEEISLNPMGSTELKFSEALPEIVAGDYTLNISIISNGATVKTLSKIFNVAPPKFEVYLYPLKPSYTVGEELCAVLNVTNIGAINGSVNIECEIPGEYKSSQKITLAPMESQNVTFNIILPDDLIDGFMKLIYRYEGKEYEHVFRYLGYLVSVDVATDKQFYNEGEKATLTFTIKNLNELNIQNMSLVVKFGDYEKTTYTSLPPKGSTSLSLTDVPVSNSGRKLFYSVYLVKHSGRSLVIDSLYLPIIKDVVQVWSDKQVYNIGDTIRFYVNSSATGTFKYTVFDTVDTLNITSPNSVYQIDLTAPELPAGTYSFDYSLSNAVADSYKFDLNGYRTKIVKVSFDKSSYIPGETISGNVTVWSNLDMTANFTASLLPPVGKIILDWNVKDIDLKAGENLIGFKLNLTQSSSPGDYAVELSIAKGGYTLSYGTRYVSVEGSVINSIKTDRKSYKQDETALLTVVLYSGTQSVLKIKSGSKLIAESVIDSVGLLTKEFSIPVKEMTTTSVEASLITPYSVSSKQTTFGIINSPPKAIAGPDKTAEVHSEITFDGSKSYDPGDDPLTYAWEFGDGNKASGPIVKHVYDSVGNYTVKLIVTDSKGAYDISTLKVNVVDTTPPKISSISPSDGSVISATTPTISASFSDNVAIDPSKVVVSLDDVDVTAGSNVTPNGFAYTPPSPLAGGLHKVHVSIIDLYGNKASLTWFFTVSIPAPVSPPAPAPAPEPTPTPPPPVANTTASIIVSIAANASLKVDISSFAPRSSLDSIEITANTSIPSVKIVTEEYTKNPTTLSLPSNVVPISFLKIEINAPPDSISQTIIRFRVAISTITAQNLDPESLQLYRFTNTWKPLATSMVRCDAEYCYFEALSSGFSYFAIAGSPILRESVPPTILSIYPEDGALLTTKRPVIVITYSDNVAVDTSTIRFLLDNVDVTSLSDVNTTALVFTPASDLSEGSHSMYFEVKDKSGNKASKSVQFTVIDNTPPAIYSPQPANGSLVTEANVTISASFHDNVAIDMSSVVVILDGVDVTSRALLTHNAVTYLATLEEGSHTVSLSVKDTSGNQATASWSFTVRLPVDYTNYVAIVIILILIVAIYMIMRKK